jgi:hypothetical protein
MPNVVIDGHEFSPEHVTLTSLVRISESELKAKMEWVDEERQPAAARAVEAERVGREVAESLRPQLEAVAASAKR